MNDMRSSVFVLMFLLFLYPSPSSSSVPKASPLKKEEIEALLAVNQLATLELLEIVRQDRASNCCCTTTVERVINMGETLGEMRSNTTEKIANLESALEELRSNITEEGRKRVETEAELQRVREELKSFILNTTEEQRGSLEALRRDVAELSVLKNKLIQGCLAKDGKAVHDGETYDYRCESFLCNNGNLTSLGNASSCCLAEDGKELPNGGTYEYRCESFLCNNGNLTSLGNASSCCVTEEGAYMKSEETSIVGCDVMRCENGQVSITRRESVPDGFVSVSDGCYFANRTAKPWNEARDDCIQLESDLAKPPTDFPAFQKFLSGIGGSWWWLGGKRGDDGEFYYISDGSPVNTSQWAEGHPKSGSDCLELKSSDGPLLYTFPCSYKPYSICQFN